VTADRDLFPEGSEPNSVAPAGASNNQLMRDDL
jgi:hypothetical protein